MDKLTNPKDNPSGNFTVVKKMHRRCRTDTAYKITICEEWSDDLKGHEKFIQDMGSKPEWFSLERVDKRLGYSKENCHWVDIR